MAVMHDEIEFKGYEQDQGQLFPAHLSEALDADDPAFFINDFVEGLDLMAFEERYAVAGERAYPPRMLLKLWLFGAIEGVYSGREISRRLRWDLRFRYLGGGLSPDFRTINRFRIRHREDFAQVFRETVHTARAAGLGKLGRVAIDGTKIRANTSRHKAMSYGRMDQAEAQLEAEIAEILSKLEAVNESEDETHGDGDGGGGLPAELQTRQRRVEKIRAVRKQLAAERGVTLKASSQKSFADPDANMMMTGEGSLQYCYNAQVAASEDGVIVASEVTTSALDKQQLVPMVEAVQATTRRKPGIVLADAGYLSEKNLEQLQKKRQRCLVAVSGRNKRKWPRGPHTQRMHRLLRLPWAQKIYKYRRTQGERPFAEIKQTMRFRRFSTRGRANIRGEWHLVCAAANALTIYRAARA